MNWWKPPTSHNSHVGGIFYHKSSYLAKDRNIKHNFRNDRL